ncbi:glycosyltransferase family 2 protein [Rufibacter glacialis]|uniref:Glycosyltransferase n=1 Tax=Rufibacter glacialis TaxID=1259555 RepID=A0A5M8QPY3_9BACT|nr:glycosyltransferase family 2 protein [Rufibacter glacialis]KAA6437338.1 glycosyltransferase [Rufibacter glacialis]GGK60120.1 glycosyl transferase [Rufibacter glacialis]
MALPTCSLIITTYNWPQALQLCLQSVRQQKVMPQEVLIADDGSGEETQKLIQQFQQDFPVPLHHVWHPDNGFQRSKILNKAIAQAKYSYVVQIDGDVIVHPRFVQDHLTLATQERFLAGGRINLSPEISALVLAKQITHFSLADIVKTSNLFNGLRWRLLRKFLANRYKLTGKNKYYVKGCNMSFWRQDLLRVNGYNENYVGWGPEDSEIAARLMNAGIRKRSLKMGGVQYHLHHPYVDTSRKAINEELLRTTIKTNITYCEKGVDQYLQK